MQRFRLARHYFPLVRARTRFSFRWFDNINDPTHENIHIGPSTYTNRWLGRFNVRASSLQA